MARTNCPGFCILSTRKEVARGLKSLQLDTVSTTGSFTGSRSLDLATPPPPLNSCFGGNYTPEVTTGMLNQKFGKLWFKKKQNKDQVKELMKAAKGLDQDTRYKLLKASASLKFCNERLILKQTPAGYEKVNAWNCGKKYCAICSSKKRNKLLRRYLDFFESETGKEILKKYDLAMFTVTLQHNKENIRVEPYYKELSEHWRNGLKYGAFKKYLAGGFYNTEHTYTKNGHHIHRHALVLISKEYKITEGGLIGDKSKTYNSEKVKRELTEQWCKRTDGSFQIDLSPFYVDKTLKENLLEVTKYVTKRGKKNMIAWEIIKAVDENAREKFYNKFGILYKIKALNMNQVNEEQQEEKQLENKVVEKKPEEKLFIGLGLKCKKDKVESLKAGKTIYGEYSFRELRPFDRGGGEKDYEAFRYENNLSWWHWLQSQYDRYTKGFFVEEWRDYKTLKERFESEPKAVQYYQGEIPF